MTLSLGVMLLSGEEAAVICRLIRRLRRSDAAANASYKADIAIAHHSPSASQQPDEGSIRGAAYPSPSPTSADSRTFPPTQRCEQALLQVGHPYPPDTPNGEVDGLPLHPPLPPRRLEGGRFLPQFDAGGDLCRRLRRHIVGMEHERLGDVDIPIEREHGHPCLLHIYEAVVLDGNILRGEASSSSQSSSSQSTLTPIAPASRAPCPISIYG